MNYILLLLEQFNAAKGYKKIYSDSKQYIDEFINWLYELQKQSNGYLQFVLSSGMDLQNESVLEINKGKFDTLARFPIVSPFADTLGAQNKNFIVYQGEPLIIYNSELTYGNRNTIYCTHNPYNESYFGNLDELHNNGYHVCYGIFGKNSDDNKPAKINFIRANIQKMLDNFVLEYDTMGDNYYCTVFTKNKIKIKEKTLTR